MENPLKEQLFKDKMDNYVVIEQSNFQQARNAIRKAKEQGKLTAFSGNDEINRKVLEKEPIEMLLVKVSKRRDKLKQRDSGFNQVLAKIAQKKKVKIGIDLDELKKAQKNEKPRIIARILQNIKIANKHKLMVEFFSKEDLPNQYDLKALGLTLGMPTWMTKNF